MIEIRPLRTSEVEAAVRMKARAWRETYDGIVPEDVLADENSDEGVARTCVLWIPLLERGATFWVAVRSGEEDEIVGVAHAGPSRDEDAPVPTELTMIYLLEAEQGRGTGSRLLDAAVGDAPWMLWVFARNEQAIRFYERHGFRADGTEKEEWPGRPVTLARRMVRSAQRTSPEIREQEVGKV